MAYAKKESYKRREKGKMPIDAGIRLFSTAELAAIEEMFSVRTGLEKNQFAVNSFGFPPIPIPEVRRGYGKIRLAPPNVEIGYLGHPIYWIHPDLTKFQEDHEDREQWAVRMFYLIDAFGYWDDEARFIDHLEVHDYSYDPNDISTYHIKSNPDCEADNIPFITLDDLDIPIEEAEDNYRIAMNRCRELVRKEAAMFLRKQAESYKIALEVLGDNVWDSFVMHDEPGGLWDTKYRKNLDDLAIEYNLRAENGETQRSDIVEAFQFYQERLVETLTTMNKASAILNTPVIASNPGLNMKEKLALVSTQLMLSARKDNVRKLIYDNINPIINKCLVEEDMRKGGVDEILSAMIDMYSESWRRLRLAFINYNVVRDGSPPFTTYVEMTNALVSATQDLSRYAMDNQDQELGGL